MVSSVSIILMSVLYTSGGNTHFVLFCFVLNSDVTHCVGYKLLLMLALPNCQHNGSVQCHSVQCHSVQYAQSILTSVSI